MARGTITIDPERCKGCELCTTVCPQNIIVMTHDKLNRKGYFPAALADPNNKCTGCAICAMMCPDVCITVYRESKLKPKEPVVRGEPEARTV